MEYNNVKPSLSIKSVKARDVRHCEQKRMSSGKTREPKQDKQKPRTPNKTKESRKTTNK